MPIPTEEYENHKKKCAENFGEIFDKLDKMDRAMFGEDDLKRKGVYDMTTEMYKSVLNAKGGERAFWITVKIAGGITVLIGCFWASIDFLKKMLIN